MFLKKILILSVVLLFSVSSFAKEKSFPEMSLFHLDSSWTNDNNKTLKLKSLENEVSIMAMVYTTCQHTCPMIMSKILDVKRKLPKDISKKVKMVLVSFDPERDTPENLKKYREKRKLNSQWILLTGKDSGIRSLAAVLGVNYKDEGDGIFSHSNVISVVNKEGVVVERIDSLQQPIDGMVKKIIKAVK